MPSRMRPPPEPAAAPHPRPGLRGLADLTLERHAGRARLTRTRTRPPLMAQQTLYPDAALPEMAYVFLVNPTGGLLDGDVHEISLTVGAGAQAHITTQSAAKIHAMPPGGGATQRIALHVAAGGYLEYLPDPLIPYRDAALDQDVVIHLEPAAALLTWEVLTPGRTAMGEAFRYRRISSRLAVYRNGGKHPAYREAFALTPADGSLMQPGLLGRAPPPTNGRGGRVLGSMLILCEPEAARAILDGLQESLPAGEGLYAAASLLPDGAGAGVKALGPDRAAVQSALSRVWAAARQELLGAPLPFLRKY